MPRTRDAISRDAAERPAIPRRQPRRIWSHVVLFAAFALLVNGLIGERGLLETMRARRSFATAGAELVRIRQENAALREQARRLRHDPGTIEAVARGELGLLRPGEILITIKDLRPLKQ